MRFITISLFACILLTAIPSGETQVLAQAPSQVSWLPSIITVGPGADPNSPMLIGRLSASHRIGDGIGFDDGYSTVEWLMPLLDSSGDQMLFFDGRGLIGNDGRLGSNIGLGYRKYFPQTNRIVGVMGYWDTRQLDSDVFHQGTFGIETLGQYFDARTFVYLPITDEGSGVSPVEPVPTGPVFTGHRLVIGPLGPVAPGIRTAMRGVTSEVGLNSPWFGSFQVSGFAGVYRFDADTVPAITGWSARTEVRMRDQFQVDVTFQDDDTLGQTTSVGMNVSQLIGLARFSKRNSTTHKFRGLGNTNVDSRLGERVRRLENIVTSRRAAPVPQIQDEPGLDRYSFFHVREGASGNGTFENPFGSINEAVAAATTNNNIFDFVYTRVGETFTEDVNLGHGVTLVSNAGLHTAHLFDTNGTTIPIPFSGADPSFAGSLTTINGSLTLDDDGGGDPRVIDGFNITQGVSITEIGHTSFYNSRVTNVGNAITVTDSGIVNLRNLTLTSTAGDGLEVNGGTRYLANFDVRNVTIDAQQEGIDLNAVLTSGHVAVNADIDGVTINSGSTGVSATTEFPSSSSPNESEWIRLRLNNATIDSGGTGIDLSHGVRLTQFEGNHIVKAGDGGVSADGVIFSTRQINSLTIGDPAMPSNIQGFGLRLGSGDTDSLGIANLTIANESGSGLDVSGGFASFQRVRLRTGPDSTITTVNGPAIDGFALDGDLLFASVTSNGSPTNGILLDRSRGSLTSATTVFGSTTGTPVVIRRTQAQFTVDLNAATVDGTDFAASNLDAPVGNGGSLDFLSDSFSLPDIP